MDFVQYAEGAAALVNAVLPDAEALRGHLIQRPWLAERAADRDAFILRRFQAELRPVFEAPDAAQVVARLNELLERHPITPFVSDHDPSRLHLHVATSTSSPAELLRSEALLGLAVLVCDLGPTRLGVCHAPPCRRAYVDTSPNQSRRYCSERCSSRANVAAYRARRKAAPTG